MTVLAAPRIRQTVSILDKATHGVGPGPANGVRPSYRVRNPPEGRAETASMRRSLDAPQGPNRRHLLRVESLLTLEIPTIEA